MTIFSFPRALVWFSLPAKQRRLQTAAVLVLATIVHAAGAAGQTVSTWTGGDGDGSWGSPLNWDTGIVPTDASTEVIIDGNADNISGSMTLDGRHRQAGSITLTGSPEKYLWASTPGASYTSARRLQLSSGITMDATSGTAFLGYADDPALGRVALRAIADQEWTNQSTNDLNFGRPITLANATGSGALIAGYFGNASPRPDVALTLNAASSGNIVVNASMNNGYAPGVGETGLAVVIDSQGTGTVFFNNAISHTGSTVVRSGTLSIGNGVTDAAFVIGDVVVEQGAAVVFDQPAGTIYNVGSSVDEAIAMTNLSGAGSVTLQGGATYDIVGPATNTGGVRVIGSTAVLKSTGSLKGTVAVDSGATLRLDPGLTKLVDGLDLAGGLVDVGSGRLDVAPGGVTELTLQQSVTAAFNGGGWDGGTGITSTAAANDASFGVGYTFDSGSGAAAVAWAALGDSNLDGLVNFDDILSLFPNYETAGNATWQQGDFNYDGAVDFDDILALFPNYGSPSYLGGNASVFGGGGIGGVAVVPEPGTLTLLMLGVSGLAGVCLRRRRKTADATSITRVTETAEPGGSGTTANGAEGYVAL